jgi:hypothetical protein
MAPAPPLTFRQLAEYDDIAVDVVCDTLFRLDIYKVSPHYRSKRADRAALIRTVRTLAGTLDLEAAYQAVVAHDDWAHAYLSRKTPEQIYGFKEYVAQARALDPTHRLTRTGSQTHEAVPGHVPAQGRL